MAQRIARICLTITDLAPEHGVHTLQTAAKLLAELRAGRRDRELSVMWMLASSDCCSRKGVALCGRIEYRTEWQLHAYLDYVRKQICDMIDERKSGVHLELGDCPENGGCFHEKENPVFWFPA